MAVKKSKNVTPEQQKKAIVEEAWLKYYNQVLFEKGMIIERERNLMINKIDARTTRSFPIALRVILAVCLRHLVYFR